MSADLPTDAIRDCIFNTDNNGAPSTALRGKDQLQALLDRIAELETENEELFQDSPAALAVRSVFGSPALNLESIPLFFNNKEGEQK